jgi:hypothetical protein
MSRLGWREQRAVLMKTAAHAFVAHESSTEATTTTTRGRESEGGRGRRERGWPAPLVDLQKWDDKRRLFFTLYCRLDPCARNLCHIVRLFLRGVSVAQTEGRCGQ